MLNQVLTVTLLLAFSGVVVSQCHWDNPRFKHFNEDDGLSNSHVRSLAMDHEGFLWVGTQNGLNRFDGMSFQNFYAKEGQSGIPDGKINDLHVAENGILWVATEGGLCSFDIQKDSISQFNNSLPDGSKRIRTEGVTEDKKGNIWLCYEHLFPSGGGIARLDPTSGEFTNYLTDNDLAIKWVEQDPFESQFFWAGGMNELIHLNSETGDYKVFKCPESSAGGFGYTDILFSNEEVITVSLLKEGIFQFHKKSHRWKKVLDLPGIDITGLMSCSDGRLQIVSARAIFSTADTTNNHVIHYPSGEMDEYTLAWAVTYDQLKDENGRIWIAHLQGLSLLDPNIQGFRYRTYKPPSGGPREKMFFYDACFPANSEYFYLGTRNGEGILEFNQESLNFTSQIKSYPKGRFKGEPIIVLHLTESDKGALFIRSTKGLFEFFPSENSIRLLIDSEHPHFDQMGSYLGKLKNNFLPISGKNGEVLLYNTVTQVLEVFDIGGSELYRRNSVGKPSLDDFGRLWFASNYYKGFIDVQSKEVHYLNSFIPTWKDSETGLMRLIEVYNDSLIYFGSQMQGLIEVNLADSSFQKIEWDPDEQIQYWVSDLCVSADGLIWTATDKGIFQWDPIAKNIIQYTRKDGLPRGNWYKANMRPAPDSSVYVCRKYQVLKIERDKIHGNTEVPQVLLRDLYVGNDSLPLKADSLVLEPNQNNLNIRFGAIAYTNPKQVKFYYRLIGFDDEWIYARDRNFTTYTNLSGGEYELQIRAVNSHGVESPEPFKRHIKVLTPFYKEAWFLVVCLFLLLLLAYIIYRKRIKSIEKEHRIKEEFNRKLAEVEMSALRAQMNPHFLFNCLNSIKFFIIKHRLEEAADYLTKFSKLIRLILNNSKTEKVSLQSEIDALSLYIQMESLRFEKGFSYSIDIDENIHTETVEIPPMLVQPFVENSIWHGLMHKEGKGKLTLRVFLEGEVLNCQIEDNGIGREKAALLRSKSSMKKKSMGMQITKDRLDTINKMYHSDAEVKIEDLYTRKGVASGTKVWIRIPL